MLNRSCRGVNPFAQLYKLRMKNFTIKAKTETETGQRREREREGEEGKEVQGKPNSRGDSSCKCWRWADRKTQAREACEFGFVTGASFVFVRPTV